MTKASKTADWDFGQALEHLTVEQTDPSTGQKVKRLVENGDFWRPMGEEGGVAANKGGYLTITNAAHTLDRPEYNGAVYYDYLRAPNNMVVYVRLLGKPQNIQAYLRGIFEDQRKTQSGQTAYAQWLQALGLPTTTTPEQLANYIISSPNSVRYDKNTVDAVSNAEAQGGTISDPIQIAYINLRSAARAYRSSKPEEETEEKKAALATVDNIAHLKGRISRGGAKRVPSETGKTRISLGKDANLLQRVLGLQDVTKPAEYKEAWLDVTNNPAKGKIAGNSRSSPTYTAVVNDPVNWLRVPYLKIAAKNSETGRNDLLSAMRTLVSNAAASQDPAIKRLEPTLREYERQASQLNPRAALTLPPAAVAPIGAVAPAQAPRVSPAGEVKAAAPAMPVFAQAPAAAPVYAPAQTYVSPSRPAGYQAPAAVSQAYVSPSGAGGVI